ncbi:MAG: glucose-6-phosphate isomerase, partial [Candidatus Aenigmarchaeota archaeon]|nr:glucose-6-phosphate isomerase [Candidatus Aenigmarchaeota archaeon]
GREFVKTAGHYHPLVPQTNVSYTEVYEVLYGNALYLLQKVEGNKVLDAYFVEAKAGDKVIIPPGYGHITINRSNDILVMANWVAANFSSIYDSLKQVKGGCYYVLQDKILKNENYSHIPDYTFKKPTNILGSLPMYKLVANLNKLKFLTEPQNHKEIFI